MTDLLQDETLSFDRKIELTCDFFGSKYVNDVFSNDRELIGHIIVSFSNICNISLERNGADAFVALLGLWGEIVLQYFSQKIPGEEVSKIIFKQFPKLVRSKESAENAVAYTIINNMHKNFVVESEKDLKVLDFFIDMQTSMSRTTHRNATAENEHLLDADYGVIITKPIFTSGISASKEYLASLRTQSGEKLIWKRLGSTPMEGINGIIDIYEGYLHSGDLYQTLYINVYGSTNSTVAPRGFVISKNKN